MAGLLCNRPELCLRKSDCLEPTELFLDSFTSTHTHTHTPIHKVTIACKSHDECGMFAILQPYTYINTLAFVCMYLCANRFAIASVRRNVRAQQPTTTPCACYSHTPLCSTHTHTHRYVPDGAQNGVFASGSLALLAM